jgi:hypothetical protein
MNNGNINQKQLEEQFKNKFENAQFSPPAHLWEQIDAALDAKPWYKRPLFYWTSGLVAALLMVVMFWFTLVYDDANSPSGTIADSDKNKIENNVGTNKNTDNSSITQTPTNNNTEVNTIETNPVQENELVADSNTKTIDSNSSNSKNSDTNSNSSIDNSTTNQDTHLNDDSDNDSDVAISIIIKDKDKDNKTDITSDETIAEINLETENTDLALIDFKEIDWSKYLPVGNPYFEKEVIVKVDSTEEAIANNKNPTESIKKSSGVALTFGINHTQGIYKPSFRTDSLYSGLTVIEAFSSNLADTLPQININGTYQQTGFDVALAFGKNQRWSINTGIGMGKANYSFGSTNYTRDTVLLGNPLIASTNNVEVNYEWTQIPIAIGYQFGESRAKKFSGFAQLGTAIELLSSYSYTSADPQFSYAMGTHRTTNTQVWTQVGINYHVTNRWAIWGGGTYKSSLSSLINENGVTFSSQSYGWQVGTRFTIFNSGK